MVNFEIESPFPFWVQFWCSGDGDIRLIGQDKREPLDFVEYMDTSDTMYSKDGHFYIARFEVQDPSKREPFYGTKLGLATLHCHCI